MLELIFILAGVLALVLVSLAAITVIIAYASQITYVDPLNESEKDVNKSS